MDAGDWSTLASDVTLAQTSISLAFQSAADSANTLRLKEEIKELEAKIADAQAFVGVCPCEPQHRSRSTADVVYIQIKRAMTAGGIGLGATIFGAVLCCFCPFAAVIFVVRVMARYG